MKDPIPKDLRSCVVYKFTCSRCNSCYIGQTVRHLKTRVREHLFTDRNSHVYKHLNASVECREACSTESFTILDSASSEYKVKIKEAMHIKWQCPVLNQQVTHAKLSLSL